MHVESDRLLGVFFASFQAWREEREARLQVEKKLVEVQQQHPVEPARNPDGLYQLGQEVATVGSARIDIGNSLVTFNGIRSAGKLDANRDIEFREYVLSCSGLPSAPPSNVFSGTVSTVSTGARCKILRQR